MQSNCDPVDINMIQIEYQSTAALKLLRNCSENRKAAQVMPNHKITRNKWNQFKINWMKTSTAVAKCTEFQYSSTSPEQFQSSFRAASWQFPSFYIFKKKKEKIGYHWKDQIFHHLISVQFQSRFNSFTISGQLQTDYRAVLVQFRNLLQSQGDSRANSERIPKSQIWSLQIKLRSKSSAISEQFQSNFGLIQS